MKRFLIMLFGAMFLFYVASLGQEKNNTLLIKAKVKNLPENQYAEGILPPESSSQVVTFNVLDVCVGDYKKKEIRVAYRGGSERSLINDEEIVIKLKPTRKYRESAEFLFMDLGIDIPEEFIADFEFVEDSQQGCTQE